MIASRRSFRADRAQRPHAQQAESEARRRWVLLLAMLASHARRVLAGEPIGREEAATLTHEVVRMKALFPIRQACVQGVGDAVLTLARGFVAAARPEDRVEMAGLLGPLIAHLDAKLTEHGHALAQVSRRWAGDVD